MKSKEEKIKKKQEDKEIKKESTALIWIVILSALIAVILSFVFLSIFSFIVKQINFDGENLEFKDRISTFVSTFAAFSSLFLGVISVWMNIKQRKDNENYNKRLEEIQRKEKEEKNEQLRLDFLYKNMDNYIYCLQDINKYYSTDSYLRNYLKIKSLLDEITEKSTLKIINKNFIEIRELLEKIDNHLIYTYYFVFQDKHYIPQVEVVLDILTKLQKATVKMRKSYFNKIEITNNKNDFFNHFDRHFVEKYNEMILLSEVYIREWNKYLLNITDFISNLKYKNSLEEIEELYRINKEKKKEINGIK